MYYIFLMIAKIKFFFITTCVIKFWIMFETTKKHWRDHNRNGTCFIGDMCDSKSCQDCKHLIVKKEGGYFWGQNGDIVGTYNLPGYGKSR